MKTPLILVGAFLALLIGAATAHAQTQMTLQAETAATTSSGGTSGTTRASTSYTDGDKDGDPQGKGNVEVNWKVEEGESVTPALLEIEGVKGESSEKKGKESGEKGGTEDINIGVGELQESKVNKIDAITVKQSIKGGVSVAAGDVNGLTEEEKREFLASVKEHAEVQSGQDLENFAKGVLLDNEDIEELSAEDTSVVVKHRTHGKLFGFIPLTLWQEVKVETEGAEAGRVKLKLPWYAFLVAMDVTPEDLEAEIGKHEKWFKSNANAGLSVHAAIFTSISNVLKTRHDTAKNSVGNIR
jgi:hypothetical protein